MGGFTMSNYNYFDLSDVFEAVAQCENTGNAVIKTSHGNVITLKAFCDIEEFITVDREGFHGVCSDMADLILCCFVRDNVKMRVVSKDGNKWYRYWDLVRVNNVRSPYYLGLYVTETGEKIVGSVGFNVKVNSERGLV